MVIFFKLLGNFTQDEIGIPMYEYELNPGDLLYFPRGFIHQVIPFLFIKVKFFFFKKKKKD